MLQAVEEMPTVSADSMPRFGTFYSAQHSPASPEPWPPLPGNIRQVPAWNLGDGVYLLDDRQVDYSMPVMSARMAGGRMMMDIPGFGDGTSGFYSDSFNYTAADYGTNLWLAITNLGNNVAGLFISNTAPDIEYEIQSKEDLLQANWLSEGFILGSELTNWTPLSVAQNGRTNLFLRVRSWIDSQGVGIPNWWQLQNFGYVGIDPYADPDGDGYNNLEEFLNGTDPTVFNSPPKGVSNVQALNM